MRTQSKHEKIRKNNKFIQIEICINNNKHRFDTKLVNNEENIKYVENNYKEIINIQTNINNIKKTLMK